MSPATNPGRLAQLARSAWGEAARRGLALGLLAWLPWGGRTAWLVAATVALAVFPERWALRQTSWRARLAGLAAVGPLSGLALFAFLFQGHHLQAVLELGWSQAQLATAQGLESFPRDPAGPSFRPWLATLPGGSGGEWSVLGLAAALGCATTLVAFARVQLDPRPMVEAGGEALRGLQPLACCVGSIVIGLAWFALQPTPHGELLASPAELEATIGLWGLLLLVGLTPPLVGGWGRQG